MVSVTSDLVAYITSVTFVSYNVVDGILFR